MKRSICFLILTALIGLSLPEAAAQDKGSRRFGIDYDPEGFPQKTAKEALASVIKAIEARKIDYLLAHLADPAYVDPRVKSVDGNFREVVKETSDRLAADPTVLRELKRFLSEGEWQEAEDMATATLKDVKARAVFFKKIDNRWYFENRQKSAEQPKEKEKDK